MTNTTTTNSSLSTTNSSISTTIASTSTPNIRGYNNVKNVSTISKGSAAGIVVGIVLLIVFCFIFLCQVRKKNYADTNLTYQKKKTKEATLISSASTHDSFTVTDLMLTLPFDDNISLLTDDEYTSSASAHDSLIFTDFMLPFPFDDNISTVTDDSFTVTDFMLPLPFADNISILTDDSFFLETAHELVNINDTIIENAFVLDKFPIGNVSKGKNNTLNNIDDNVSEITYSTYSCDDVSIAYIYDDLYIETLPETFPTKYLQLLS